MFANDFRWGLVSYRNQQNDLRNKSMDWFLRPEGRSEQTIILHWCGSGKYTTVLCFSTRGNDARVPAPSWTWGVEGFLERSLMCWVIVGLGCVFHFGISEQEETIALQQFNVRVGWLKIVDKMAWNFNFQKSYFLIYVYIDLYINLVIYIHWHLREKISKLLYI